MNGDTRSSSRKIPVVLCIDVEPDEFFVDRAEPKPWTGFEFTHDYLRKFRERFAAATGQAVRFNWFLRLDPQVAIAYGDAAWGAKRYEHFFREYRSAGDEIGLHVHTYRWLENPGRWLDDCGNAEWAAYCLENSHEHFERAFGAPARSLRFGNYWVSTAAINQAEALGYEFDLTVEPGLNAGLWSSDKKPATSGELPDFYRVPRIPYAPSRSDFKKRSANPDDRSIRLMPLTSASLQWGWGVRDFKRRLGRLARNGLQGRRQNEPLSMWRTWGGDNSFTAMLDRALASQERPYLAFAIRSNVNGKEFEAYDSSLHALLNHPAASNFVFCTPRQAMGHLAT